MIDKANQISIHLERCYGINTLEINQIDHGVINSNFRIHSRHGSYIFKIYNLRDELNVSFELEILEFLSLKKFPSPRAIADKAGRLFRQFQAKPAVLLRYIPGRMITDITDQQMFQIGEGVGALHRILENYRQEIERVTWEPDDIRRHIQVESKNIIRKNYPDALNFVSFISREFKNLEFPVNLPMGITHQDIKPDNIIIDQEGHISFIDFNDCYKGTLLFDIMTTVIWSCFEVGALDFEMFKSYLGGYMKERPLTLIEKEYCFTALLFRLLREAFVWPMRFSSDIAEKRSKKFLSGYRYLRTHEGKYRSMIASLLANS